MCCIKKLIFALLFISFSVLSTESLFATFEYNKAKSGSAISNKITSSNEALALISDHKIKIKNLPKNEVILLANVLKNLDELSVSKQFNLIDGTTVRYVNELTKIYARQTKGPIDIGPNAIGNYGVYTHELGHVVGNHFKGKTNFYSLYNKAVKSPCHFSEYSSATHGHGLRNEEFAEVFAAYSLAPELLQSVSRSCNEAYEFMKDITFSLK